MTSATASTTRSATAPWRERLFEPVPVARVAILRLFVYVFSICDLFWVVNDVIPHASDPVGLYRPVRMRTLLHLPAPSPVYAHGLRVVIIAGCVLMVASCVVRVPARLVLPVGWVVAAAMTDWVSIGESYGKIDHDHFALITALWVLPSIGPARLTDREPGEAVGWALFCVQVGVVATYFLSALAKIRFGGWDWVTGYTFAWAMTRRGTELGREMLHAPWTLRLGQWALFCLELSTPLLLVLRRRSRYLFVVLLLGFHLTTYLTLKIHFLPLVVCLPAFLPLERVLPAAARADERRLRPAPSR